MRTTETRLRRLERKARRGPGDLSLAELDAAIGRHAQALMVEYGGWDAMLARLREASPETASELRDWHEERGTHVPRAPSPLAQA